MTATGVGASHAAVDLDRLPFPVAGPGKCGGCHRQAALTFKRHGSANEGRRGPAATGSSSFDRALVRAVDELHRDAEISDRTWVELATRYDTKQLMDVVFSVGQYNRDVALKVLL